MPNAHPSDWPDRGTSSRRVPQASSRWPLACAALLIALVIYSFVLVCDAPARARAHSACRYGVSTAACRSKADKSAGSFTAAFARCMRAHGVPRFPYPNGHGGQLSPGSGVDPGSKAFQAAINGPCRSLAPAGWVGTGPVTR